MPNWLGDVVMATSAIEALHRTGKYAIHLLIRPPLGELFQNDPRAAEIISCVDRGPALLQTAADIRRRKFTAAVDFTHSLRSRILWRMSGVSNIYREGRPNFRVHQIRRYTSVVQPLCGPLPPVPWPPSLTASHVPPSTDEILLFPSAAYGLAKMWSIKRYQDLIKLLLDRGHPVRLLGTVSDRPFLEKIVLEFKSEIQLSAGLPIPDLMRLISASRAVISCDSGAAHLAAALGRPVVVLFFSTDPAATTPLGYAVRQITAAVPCRPCFLRKCPIGYLCRDAVTAEQVLGQLDDIFDEPPPAPKNTEMPR